MMAAIYARIVVAVICGLLAFATSASAECAWVLWNGQLLGSEWVWDILCAHPTMKECSEDLQLAGKVYTDDGHVVTGLYRGSRQASYRKGESRSQLKCLPDTIDPRGPKGK